jgi:hypothetical protein
MSTNPTNILATLASGSQALDLVITLGGELIPIGKWLFSEFKATKNAITGTMTYTAVVTADQAELATMLGEEHVNLGAINAELVRIGKPPLAVPVDPSAPPTPAQG